MDGQPAAQDSPVLPGRAAQDLGILAGRILHFANSGASRLEFLREVSGMLLEFTRCDSLEIRLGDRDLRYVWEAGRNPIGYHRFEVIPPRADGPEEEPAAGPPPDLDQLCADVLQRRFDPDSRHFTKHGSFWTGDAGAWVTYGGHDGLPRRVLRPDSETRHGSLAVVRFVVDDSSVGLLLLRTVRCDAFNVDQVAVFEHVAQTLGLAGADRRAQWALRERVKEMTCLYGISRQAEEHDAPLGTTLQKIVEILPPAWQFPDIAAARIVLDGRTWVSAAHRDSPWRQSADILVEGAARGVVEVVYLEERPEFAEGVFLREEQHLIDTVAREIARIVHRKQAEDDRVRLHDQLRHADRLATIGQLTAGVAHEINEPLGSILGFAQLALKQETLPGQAAQDLRKVVAATLHAREIVRKLLLFSRQMPPRKVLVKINDVVEEGLAFLEPRCARAGVEVVRKYAPDLDEIVADPAQIQQVLVNLVVNAVQAMPMGGNLTVETRSSGGGVTLAVEDTGVGMTEEVQKQIFTPFFTTKGVGQGTGLGLPVVHGIVTSHGGTIHVDTRIGRGTRFEIHLPAEPS